MLFGLLYAITLIGFLWYICKLHARIRSSDEDWKHIAELADHNKDGDVVIHVKHTEK